MHGVRCRFRLKHRKVGTTRDDQTGLDEEECAPTLPRSSECVDAGRSRAASGRVAALGNWRRWGRLGRTGDRVRGDLGASGCGCKQATVGPRGRAREG